MPDKSVVSIVAAPAPGDATVVKPTHVRVTVLDEKDLRIYAFVSEHVLSFIFQRNWVWLNRDQGELWDNWKTEQEIWFSFKRVNKDGSRPLQVYGKERPLMGRFKDGLFRNWNLRLGGPGLAYYFRNVFAQATGLAVFLEFFARHGYTFEHGLTSLNDVTKLMFPGIGLSEREVPSFLSPRISAALRAKDARTVTARLVGKRRVRRDLVREVALVDSVNLLELLPSLARVVPVDWIVEGLHERQTVTSTRRRRGYVLDASLWERDPETGLDKLETLLGLFPLSMRRKLVVSLFTMDAVVQVVVNDTALLVRQAKDLRIPVEGLRVDSFVELHDELARLTREAYRRSFVVDTAIELTKEAELFNDLRTPSGFTLVAAASSKQVYGWSVSLRNCIHSYVPRARDGLTVLLGVYRDDKLLANAEVKDHRLVQLSGLMNSLLPVEYVDEIVGAMRSVMPSLELSLVRRGDEGWF